MAVCYAYQKGECNRGEDCKFLHEINNNVEIPARKSGGRGVCFSFQKGECEYGESCRFSHNTEGGNGGFSNFNSGGSGYRSNRSAGPCFAFQRGECERGDTCKFSHGEGSAAGTGFSAPRKSAGVCYAFQSGECDRGDNCRFSHEVGDVPSSYGGPSARGPCYAYARGQCDRGTACRFNHDNAPDAPAEGEATYNQIAKNRILFSGTVENKCIWKWCWNNRQLGFNQKLGVIIEDSRVESRWTRAMLE